MLFSPQILVRRQPKIVTAPAASAWGDHGTNVALSTTTVANDTATGLANSFSTVRGAQAYTSGKHYFEIKCLSANAVHNFYVGIMDNTTANGAAMDDRLLANSTANLDFNGNTGGNGWAGTNLGAPFTLVANDILGYAWDGDNGFGYLSLNGTYYLSGDPTSGASGTGAVANGLFTGVRPMITVWGDSIGSPTFPGSWQLITASGSLANLPSGYTAWG